MIKQDLSWLILFFSGAVSMSNLKFIKLPKLNYVSKTLDLVVLPPGWLPLCPIGNLAFFFNFSITGLVITNVGRSTQIIYLS